ncbi:MAG: di-trans,poly-cis-decaprenylcistransferase [Deltaproteobacteria bacterium]|jgi:undecaprenyl diphosphate synthase|nr:di-trans,poly-cis-decaprenylcistransferase [Deltaproteobacteria bacterium]
MDASSRENHGPPPGHVAVIMDGNGRWAEARGLPRSEGHRAGAEPVRTLLKCAARLGVRHLTLYAFSSENWQRSPEEIGSLFTLLARYLDSETAELLSSGVRLNAIGDLSRLPGPSLAALRDAVEALSGNEGITLTLAISYGSRAEIAQAAARLAARAAAGALPPEDIDEGLFASELWSAALPDVDLLIRTGGDKRVSNFLLWKIAYAELYFTDTLWPDFGEEDFLKAIDDFRSRERRFGRA